MRSALAAFLTAFLLINGITLPAAIASNVEEIKTHTVFVKKEFNLSPVVPVTKKYADGITISDGKDEIHGSPVCGGAKQERCDDKPAVFKRAAVGSCPKGSFLNVGDWACYSCPPGYDRSVAAIDDYKACQKQLPKPKLLGEFKKADMVSTLCPSGSFYDPIRGGECWSCPKGYERTGAAVFAPNACQKPAREVPSRAKFVKKTGCPPGSFFDPRKGGECWSCPKDYKRSAAPVTAGNACYIPAHDAFARAKDHGKGFGVIGTDCKGGQFLDVGNGRCYSCPSGYNRTAFGVTSSKACSRAVGEQQAKASYRGRNGCDKGSFFDPRRGGECWSCPKGFQRTAAAVTAGNACARVEKPVTARAKLVTRAECKKGEIKDLVGSVSSGGSCWVCPKGTDRTVFPIDGNKACEKSLWYTFAKAEKKEDLTCPAGEVFDFVGLSPKDIQTRPEFRRGKKPRPVASGTCWSCPTGYDRTMADVKSNQACTAKYMVWGAGYFREPGLFGFADKGLVERVLMDIANRKPDLIASVLNKAVDNVVKANKTPHRSVFRTEEKNLRENPNVSTVAAGIIMRRIMAAIASPNKATSDEKALALAFGKYIQKRRVFMAEEALQAYYAWKKSDDENRTKRTKNSLLGLIDYGTVPPEFGSVVAATFVSDQANSAVSTAAGIAAGSVPVVGAVLGDLTSMATGQVLNGFADFGSPDGVVKFAARNGAEIVINKAIEVALDKMVRASIKKLSEQVMAKALAHGAIKATADNLAAQAGSRTLASLAGAGPGIIIAVNGMILSQNIDNFIKISEAEGRLKTSLTMAQRPVDLQVMARMAKTEEGMMELLTNWGYLISGEAKVNREFLSDWGRKIPDIINKNGSVIKKMRLY